MKINIGSWNIWVFGSRDFKGIAKLVKENKIDILGIQEAGVYFDKGQENMTEKIAKELDFNYIFYPASDIIHNDSYRVGNAIFSKFPIIESKFYPLNPSKLKYNGTYETEPRILVHSKINLGNNKLLNFLTTHLQFSLEFKTTTIRIAQVENILSIIKKLGNPIVLAGDFNTTSKSEEIRKIENLLTRIDGDEPTWTIYPFEKDGWRVEELKYRLDNIFVSKGLIYKNFKIIESKISDHLPIMVSIDI